MFHYFRERMPSTDGKNHESVDSIFNNGFVTLPPPSSSSSISSSNFDSVEAIHPTNNDDSDFQRLVENDSLLKNTSLNDSSSISLVRSPSLIIAAGTVDGSTTNASIESLQSTIIDGALDSDASYYSSSETLKNLYHPANNLLNQRLSSEDEFIDCDSNPESQTELTLSSSSTKYKSLTFASSSNRGCLRSENNNTIFKETDKSKKFQPSENYDSGIGLLATSKFLSKHLTTILEESTVLSNRNSKRISGDQLIPLIENFRKSSMPSLPQTEIFKDTITTLAQILDKSSKEITIDQLAKVLLYTLKTDYNYSSEHLSEPESCFSFAEFSKISGLDLNNTGAELNSIMKQLKSTFQPDKNIESESSPDWPPSSRSTMSRSPLNTSNQNKIIQGCSRSWGRKEYFPMPPFCSVESNKENRYMNEISRKETVNTSPMKNKVRFFPKVCQFSSLNKNVEKPQKKKYVATPRFKSKEDKSNSKVINTTTGSEDSFFQREQNIAHEERKSQRNLRRSLSMSDIVSEESSTTEISKTIKRIHFCSENRKLLQKIPRFPESNIQERTKKYRKRRSRSLENNGHHPVQTNFDFNKDSSRSNINRPSTSGIQRKRFPNYQKTKNSSQKVTVMIGDISSGKTTTLNKIQQIKGKNSVYWKSPRKNSQSRRSGGIDSSNIPAVSQLRKVFSPASREKGSPEHLVIVPRIEITKSSPERSMDQSPNLIKKLHCRKIFHSKSQEIKSPRKPWKP